jgi:exopolyphosphatase/guanosine-5'-triphosphate,3'-diphosphate pyrophosphatase
MLLAVIDCGTNAFHLLLAAPLPEGGFRTLAREQVYVYLAEEGIRTLGDAPFRRGIETLRRFRETIDRHGPARVKAVGTAALRTASNGQEFLETAQQEAGIEIEAISGDEEARLICHGVRLAVPLEERPMLIMDIGGGSVEYIVADRERMLWAQSLPIGVSVLFQTFQQNDPLTPEEIHRATAHLEAALAPVAEAARVFAPVALIGASGTFDVLERLLAPAPGASTWSELPVEGVRRAIDTLMRSTPEERAAMPEVPPVRAQPIALAMVLIEVSLRLSGCERVLYSQYALQHGLLGEIARHEKTSAP